MAKPSANPRITKAKLMGRRLLRGEHALHAALLVAVLLIVTTDLRGHLGAILFVAFVGAHVLTARGYGASMRTRSPTCERAP
jgi:hypothetical protein